MNETIEKMLKENRDLLCCVNLKAMKAMNRIVESSLKEMDKKNAILIYLKCNANVACGEEFATKYLVDSFCLNEKFNSKKCFSKILRDMSKIANLSKHKLRAIVSLGNHYSNLDDNDFYFYLSLAIKSKAEFETDCFIEQLLQNETIKNYPQKLEIILSVAYKQGVTSVLSDHRIEPYLLEILTNDKALLLDEIYYTKLLKLCFHNTFWYPFYVILKESDLSDEQIRVAMDYYNTILFKYFQEYGSAGLETLEKNFNLDLFTIVLNSNFLTLNVDEYRLILEHVSESPMPFSSAKVLNDEELDRKYIALSYIEEGTTPYEVTSLEPSDDDKDFIANIAISKLARYLNDDEYNMILSQVNDYINEYRKPHEKITPDIDIKRVIREKLMSIDRIFRHGIFYKDNMPRLFYVLNVIMSSNDGFYISEIGEIAADEDASYFTDDEFKLVLNTVSQIRDLEHQGEWIGEKFFRLSYYFTNNYIPYEKDKYSMIAQVWDVDAAKLKELTEKYNKMGREERIIRTILNGFEDKEKLRENIKVIKK